MKKSCIIMSLAILLAVVSSCKKNEKETTSFTASIEVDNRTSLDGNKVYWSTGDQITVYNDNASHLYTLQEQGPTQLGTFTTTGGLQPTTSSYWGVYPYNSCTSLNRSNDQFTFTFDASSQTYVEGGFSDELNPMAGKNTNSSHPNRLYFQNAFSILKINATGNDCDITSIELTTSGSSYALTGTYVYSYGSQTLTQSSGSGNIITLSCPGVKLTSTTKSFNIVVPPCALANGFTITFKNGTSTVDDPFSVTAAQVSSNYTIASNKVFQATMDVELSGIRNLLPEMIPANWYVSTGNTLTASNNGSIHGVKFTTSSTTEVFLRPGSSSAPGTVQLNKGHSYYVRFYVKMTDYGGTQTFDFYWPEVSNGCMIGQTYNPIGDNNKWKMYSAKIDNWSPTGTDGADYSPRIDFNALTGTRECHACGAMLIDLTAHGLQSLTKAQCDGKAYFYGVTPTW